MKFTIEIPELKGNERTLNKIRSMTNTIRGVIHAHWPHYNFTLYVTDSKDNPSMTKFLGEISENVIPQPYDRGI